MRGNPIILFIATIVPEILFFLLKDTIIINLGIEEYRTIGYAVHLLFIFMAVITASSIWRKYKDREIKASQLAELDRNKQLDKEKESYLSVKKDLDPAELQFLLNKRIKTEEVQFVRQLYIESLSQMKKMDLYQDKLNSLIVPNGAEGLSDSKNILDQCEQYLCKNVRKIMNKAELSFSENGMSDPEYRQIMDANDKVLHKVDDLMHSIVDFLNSQGDSSNELTMLEMYKGTIQDILKEKKL